MADKHREIAEKVLAAVGGTSNIVKVTHCMTRLRFVLKDMELPKEETFKQIKGVMGVNIAGDQYQVIIGNSVGNVYQELMKISGMSGKQDQQEAAGEKGEKKNPVIQALDFIAGCMTPMIPAIIAGGMIKVLLIILTTLSGVLSTEGTTYIFLNALGDAPFYFLPVFVAFTASKKINCNSYLAVMVAAMLIYPDMITMLGAETPTYLFGVIPVIHGSYSSSIIPAMLSTILLKYVDKLSDKITPNWSKNFLKPLLTVLITAPVTLCVLAPLGLVVGNVLQLVINGIYGFAPWLAMALLAGAMPFIVMTGMHWAFVPTMLVALADPGYEMLVLPAMLASNMAQSGAIFGVAVKTKDNDTREIAIPAGISALLAGITEPGMYGITLPMKKPMAAACIAGSIGGLIAGMTKLKGYAFATPALTSIVQFVSPDGGKNLICALIVLAEAFIAAFVLTLILVKDTGKEKTNKTEINDTDAMQNEEKTVAIENQDRQLIITSPIKGKVIPLSEVKDATFAGGILGEGFAVEPEEGKVYAPFDGTCVSIFDTLHALALESDTGAELLIHVGIDTVKLNGEPFMAHISDGQHFRRGDLLLEFDIDKIKAGGCEIQTPVIVTNADDLPELRVESDRIVIGG